MLKTNIKIISLLVIIQIIFTISNVNALTQQEKVNIFKNVEKQFIADIGNKVIEKEKGQISNSTNKCDFAISNIAMAFSKMESQIGGEGLSIPTKNWTSIHPASRSVFYIKRDGKSTMSRGETIRKYNTISDGIYDFMYLYKYFYKCNVSYPMILTYIYGMGDKTQTQKSHALYYYNNLMYFLNQYENTATYRNITFFNKVRDKVLSDMKNSKLKFPKNTKTNKCQYDLAKIAYAFQVASNQPENTVRNTHNLFGISKYRTSVKSIGTNDNGIVNYLSEEDSIYDFMISFKYHNNCIVSKDSVRKWFYGDSKVNENVLTLKYNEIQNLLITE